MRKKCSKCRRSKETKHFSRNATLQDGYDHYCKKCNKERMSEYFQSKAGKAAMKRASKAKKKKN